MHAKIISATTIGVNSHPVEVEVDVSLGLVNFFIVGLPDTAIKESSKRILTALKNSGIRLPSKKITVNLAPADIKKVGTLFDLPIALGILAASDHLSLSHDFLSETIFLGELSLDGSIKSIKGSLAIAYDASKHGKKRLILPEHNVAEASLIQDLEIIGVNHITQVVAYLRGEITIQPTKFSHPCSTRSTNLYGDFSEVRGQHQAKRALQIAAAGRHNILFVGSPGSGKTMLAKRLPSIMPAMTYQEILETSKIYSVSGKLEQNALIVERPFRSPHHTISQPGLVGGGTYPQPGEISLAHHGVLFLDELTEFKRDTLEVLRQPLEHKKICITRSQQTLQFPASFLLIAALNPCPCGFLGDSKRMCLCSSVQISKYLSKLSGPLLDRIDLQLHVQSLEYGTLKNSKQVDESSATMYERVSQALNIQTKRFGNDTTYNAHMTTQQIEEFCVLTTPAEHIMKQAFEKLNLSMRGYHKILKVARTIADLEGSSIIDVPHLQEAIMYRSLDQSLERHRL